MSRVVARLRRLAGESGRYNPFNLVVGELPGRAWFYSSVEGKIVPLGPGVHGVSNGELEASWPRVQEGRRRFEEQLIYIAEHDELTGAYNRRRLEDELATKLREAEAKFGGDPEKILVGASAETNGLARANCGPADRVVLLASDTADGNATAAAVCKLVEQALGAKVTVVDNVIDAASGMFGVRLILPNPQLALPAGIRCNVTFAMQSRTSPALIASDAPLKE